MTMRVGIIAGRIAADELVEQARQAIEKSHVSTMFHPELKSKRGKRTGNKHTFDCVLVLKQGIYTEDIPVRMFLKNNGNEGEKAMLEAFEDYIQDNQNSLRRKVINHMEDPKFAPRGFSEVVGYNEADDYEDIRAKVKSMTRGRPTIGRWGVDAVVTIKITYTASKLPSRDKGPYDEMSDRELKEHIQAWANFAPENFWMDGEYRGSAAQRIRDLMRQWRSLTPNQQVKHYEDLRRWI